MSKQIAVVVDSSSSVTPAEAKKLAITVQPLLIVHGADKTYKDGVDIDSEQLYRLIQNNEKLSTSQVPPGEDIALVESLLATHDAVVCLPISSGLSSSYSTWKSLEAEFGDKLHVLDGKTIGINCADIAITAKKLLENEQTREEVDKTVAENAANTYGMLICNDFQRLVKGGRMGAFKGAVATLLKLHVLIEFADGKLNFKNKSRSQEKLIGEIKTGIAERLKSQDGSEFARASFLHTFAKQNKAEMEAALAMTQKTIGADVKLEVRELPAVIACHVGLNAFAVIVHKKTAR